MINKINRCRICGSTEMVSVLDLGNQSLTGVFPRSLNDNITSGPLELMKCLENNDSSRCGLVQLGHSYDKSEMYGQNYGYRSGLNRSMVAHLKTVAEQANQIAAFQADDVIVDIGSNDGTFLGLWTGRVNTLVGVDPTIVKFARFYDPRIIRIADFFNAERVLEATGGKKAAMVTTIAMFYDLDDPIDFARQVYKIMDEKSIWILEQSYLLFMLRQTAYDTICHEHQEYYALKQLKWVLDRAGFKIIDIEYNDTNGGSIKITAAQKGSPRPECTSLIQSAQDAENQIGLHTLKPFQDFQGRVQKHRQDLIELLDSLNRQGKTVFGYGASTKGNVILQYCGLTPCQISCIAEVNEEKFGLFTPQTYIPIVPETQARSQNPDYFLVFPWHFKNNFIEKEKDFLNRGGKFIFPLPDIKIVG